MNNLTVAIHLVGKPVCPLHGELTHWIALYAEQLDAERIHARVCLRCLRAAVVEQSQLRKRHAELVASGATPEAALVAVRAAWDGSGTATDDATQRFGLLELF